MLNRLVLLLAFAACKQPVSSQPTYAVPGFPDREYELRVPATWDGTSQLPVVLLLHGGGGNRSRADQTTCPRGDVDSPECFAAIALARGYAVAIPEGTPARLAPRMRTWNGGGGDQVTCVSGRACEEGVDDIAYFRTLLDDVGQHVRVGRVFATGISNGGAMAHRLACELPDRITAIASVAGGNQHAFAGGACHGTTAVLEIHGTADTIWKYTDSDKIGAEATMTAWAKRNGCLDTFVDESLGAASTRRTWQGCAKPTQLITHDAGHTWPNGHPYLPRAGRVTTDFGSEVIVAFFDSVQ